MLNNKKIRLMTKLAIYEQNEGRKDIKMSKFYKSDYVRYNLIKTFISVTIAYLLILFMIAVYFSEYLIANAVELDYQALGVKVFGIYIIIIAVYLIGSVLGYGFDYELSRKRLAKYYKRLKNLEKQYSDDKNENA